MSSSLSDVKCEVEYLRSIEQELVSSVDGKAKSLGAIKQLTSVLSSLDAARTKAHEKLEAETIAASVLRHRLGTFQQTLQVELAGIISAAESSVVSQKTYLQKCLSDLKAAGAQIERRQTVLELQSEDLVPRLKSEVGKYQELIEEVNQLMTKRSKVKIVLNETLDKLQSTLSKTGGLTADMARLEEETMEICKDFEVEQKRLHTTLVNIKVMVSTKEDENKQLTRECNTVEDDATKAVNVMRTAQQRLSDVTMEIHRQMDLKQQLQTNIKQEGEQTQELTNTSARIQSTGLRTREHFQNEEKQLKEQRHVLLEGVKEIEAEVNVLAVAQKRIQTALRKERDSKDKHQLSVTSIQESVCTLKKTLQFQSEEGAKLQAENQEFEFQLSQCIESYQTMCGLHEDQIQCLQHSLEEEKDVRRNMEAEISEMESQISSLEDGLATTTTTLCTSEETRRRIGDTTLQKLTILQNSVQRAEEHNAHLKNELLMATTKLQSLTDDLHFQSRQLEERNATFQSQLMNKLAALEELKPRCTSLEDEHRQRSATYDAEKEAIICMKSKRNELRDTAKRLQSQLESTIEVQDALRMEVISQRAYSREQLKCQMACVQKTEKQVAMANQQLKAVVMANSHITEMIETLQKECFWIKEQYGSDNDVYKHHVHGLRAIRETLRTRWEEKDEMEKDYACHCEDVLKRISLLFTQSEMRKRLTSDVHSDLKEQMKKFE